MIIAQFISGLALTYTASGRRITHPIGDEPLSARSSPFAAIDLHPSPPPGWTQWRVRLTNPGPEPIFIDRITLLDTHLPDLAGPPARVFCNGWQSWNWSGSYGAADRFQRTRLGPLTEPMRLGHAEPQPGAPGRFRSEMFGVIGQSGASHAWLLGFLSQLQHFGALDVRLDGPTPYVELWADGDHTRLLPGAEMVTDWAVAVPLDLGLDDPLGEYLEAAYAASSAGYGVDRARPALAGWSSWYQFFRELSAEDVRRNLAFAVEHKADLPLDLIQIDDGFETFAGDWFDCNPRFPDGLAPLAHEIGAAGFTPGLWLAPYIVDRRSRLARAHPDWLLKGRSGKPANAGFLHNRLAAGLDLTHPDALDYTVKVIETAVKQWGFPFLKLDFLYAAALPGQRHDPDRTRAQALRAGLERIRQAAGPDTFLLGCGCPLGPGIGIFDGMRISADVGPEWLPSFNGIQTVFSSEPDMPAARNAIQNSLTRSLLHRRWWLNDPDCLLARPTTRLSLAEIQTLATVIACTGGLTLLSDALPALPPERLELIRRLLPPTGQRPCLPGWLAEPTPSRLRLDLPNGAHRLALFNWDDQPRDLTLRLSDFGLEGDFQARELWSGAEMMLENGVWEFAAVPAHGCIYVDISLKKDEP